MPRFATFTVASVEQERAGLQWVRLDDGSAAHALTDLVGPLSPGDRVVVNTTAVDLGLGTGGAHVVHWNLARESWQSPGAGRVLKVRYTSVQTDVGAAEESDGVPAGELDGTPVVVCGLHSQLAAVAAVVRDRRPSWRIAFVMTDSASLPLALSDLAASLREGGLVDTVVTAGQAFGGDLEAVNVASALLLATAWAGADVVVVAPGPGVVGTGTPLGFSSLDVAATLDVAAVLGGDPILCVRYAEADPRPRHRGISHQSLTALRFVGRPGVRVAVPQGATGAAIGAALSAALPDGHHVVVPVDVPDVAALLAAANIDVTTMGRRPADDPGAFTVAGAAGALASCTDRLGGTVQW